MLRSFAFVIFFFFYTFNIGFALIFGNFHSKSRIRFNFVGSHLLDARSILPLKAESALTAIVNIPTKIGVNKKENISDNILILQPRPEYHSWSLNEITISSRQNRSNMLFDSSSNFLQHNITYNNASYLDVLADEISGVNVNNMKNKNILLFVNKKSGGRIGRKLVESLLCVLSPEQVCDLSISDPKSYLNLHKENSSNLRIICCGGDGTVNWILNELQMCQMSSVPIGIIPLGTGNDLYNYLESIKQCTVCEESLGRSSKYRLSSTSSSKSRNKLKVNQIIKDPMSYLNEYLIAENESRLASAYVDRWDLHVKSANYFSKHTKKAFRIFLKIDQKLYRVRRRIKDYKARVPYQEVSLSSTSSGISSRTQANHTSTTMLSKFIFTNLKNIRTNVEKLKNRQKQFHKSIINYFGIGVDGIVSARFAEWRRKYPYLFLSSFLNKAIYGMIGFLSLFKNHHDLSDCVDLWCDGAKVEIPRRTFGVIVLNINSYAGGSRLWTFGSSQASDTAAPTSRSLAPETSEKTRETEGIIWQPLRPDDQFFEVVAVTGILHLGKIKAGIASPIPLAQGRRLTIETKRKLHMQADGEPWRQRRCKIELSWMNRCTNRSQIFLPPYLLYVALL